MKKLFVNSSIIKPKNNHKLNSIPKDNQPNAETRYVVKEEKTQATHWTKQTQKYKNKSRKLINSFILPKL